MIEMFTNVMRIYLVLGKSLKSATVSLLATGATYTLIHRALVNRDFMLAPMCVIFYLK